MPLAFDKCVAAGGRVRTKSVNKTEYIKICFIDGKSYAGETHTYKKVLKKGR